MRKIVPFVVTGVMLAMVPTEASAWYCRATSANASGWGRSSSIYRARQLALYHCAIRTPRGRWCRIRYCVP